MLCSYLQDQPQTTQIALYILAGNDTTCGVRQGSILAPLLLLIYIKDIQESSEKQTLFIQLI